MAAKYYFDGVEQYLEIPSYSTLGDPDVYRTLEYGTDNEDGYITDGVEPITEIGRVGSNHHEGTIFDLRFTDISPIQNTAANEGNDLIYLNSPRLVIEGGFQITFDWKRAGAGSSFTLLTGKDALQVSTNTIVINAGDDLVITDLNGTVSTVTDAFAGVADGQHCHVKIRAVEDIDLEEGETNDDLNNLIVFVDGIETGRVSVPNLDYFLRLEATGVLPDGMVIQNLGIGPDGASTQWVLPLAEGSGVVAYNSNTETRNKMYATNVQPFSNDLTVEGGTEPPPPPPPPPTGDRQDVIYFSGGETGAIQAKSNIVDGWGIQNLTPYVNQALSVATNSTGVTPLSGTRMIRAYYDYENWGLDSSGKIRSELRNPGNFWLEQGEEYWIGWALFMKDNANNRSAINKDRTNCHCVQWHETPGTGTSGINMRNGRWMYRFGTLGSEHDCGAIILGQWNKFVMNVKISTGTDGFAKLWINAVSPTETPVSDRTGQTLWSGTTAIDIKIGVYWTSEVAAWVGNTYREHFYDEYRLARGPNASFYSVYPGSLRRDVIYFSGGESGPNWPASSSTTDGWQRQNLAGQLDAALTLPLASDHGIAARAGTRVMRAYYSASWGQDSGGNYRSEVLQPANMLLLNGNEYWIGFSVYMKNDTAMQAVKATTRINSSVFQFHQVDGTSTSQMMIRENTWEFRFGTLPNGKQVVGTPTLGVWTDFVIHCRVSTGTDGFCKLWINADSEADTPDYYETGASCWSTGGTNGALSFKMGIYRNDLIEDGIAYCEQFYDEIRIARGSGADFNSVKPG